jgi:hypothetical protein
VQVLDVYGQLAVALELLAAREAELSDADALVQHHEASLAEVRSQHAAADPLLSARQR